jgi:acetyl esterase/lipase
MNVLNGYFERRFGMKRSFVGILLAIAAIAIALPSIAKERQFPTSEKPALDDVYPERKAAWAGGVTSYADVVYSTIPGYRPLVVDVYMPPKKGGLKPLILYIHGGGWVGGHTRHSGALSNFPAALASLASEGFVVASLEYRLADEARFPAQVQDARAALRYLKGNAAKYGIDAARTGIWGGSAGGHLSALTALSCGDASLEAGPGKAVTGSECVQSAVIWYGVFDFAALAAGRPGGNDGAAIRLLGCKAACTAQEYGPASPVTYIDAKDPPFLLIHGEGDKVVPVAQSHLMEDRLKAANVPVESIFIAGVDHSFIGATAAETRAATLVATNATFNFFHKTLGVK